MYPFSCVLWAIFWPFSLLFNASKTHPKSSHDKFKTASEEYAEVLHRLTDYETTDYVVKTILNSPFVELITPYFHFNLITADLDDNKFVDCAISANARYIVTNDHHYDVLKSINFPNVNVIIVEQDWFAKNGMEHRDTKTQSFIF